MTDLKDHGLASGFCQALGKLTMEALVMPVTDLPMMVSQILDDDE